MPQRRRGWALCGPRAKCYDSCANMDRPQWFDWLTVAAIVLGPFLALFAQRALDRIREKQNQRLLLYVTLMATRATFLAPEHVRALNSIDVVFDRKRDGYIKEAWQKVLGHVAT